MAKAVQKIKLSPSRDIPFNKLVLAQSNVRRTKAGISIEDLADQFRAFQTLREQGRSEEDIAAIFFVSINVVKQRLRLEQIPQKVSRKGFS